MPFLKVSPPGPPEAVRALPRHVSGPPDDGLIRNTFSSALMLCLSRLTTRMLWLKELDMEPQETLHARSADVLIEGGVAVLSFLTAIDDRPNVAISMRVHVLELLQSRISRALAAQPKQKPPD